MNTMHSRVERSEYNVVRDIKQGTRAEYTRAKQAKAKVARLKLEAQRQRRSARTWMHLAVYTWTALALLNLVRVLVSL